MREGGRIREGEREREKRALMLELFMKKNPEKYNLRKTSQNKMMIKVHMKDVMVNSTPLDRLRLVCNNDVIDKKLKTSLPGLPLNTS